MASTIENSIVLITSEDTSIDRFGTGFVIYRQGNTSYLLTCAHVVNDIGSGKKLLAGNKTAEIVACSDNSNASDLAVLKVEDLLDAPPLKLGVLDNPYSDCETAGYWLYDKSNERYLVERIHGKLGKQVGLSSRGRAGFVRAWEFEVEGGTNLQPGYSGSPVIDELTNSVVGVISYRLGQGKKGLAISVKTLEEIWSEIPPELFIFEQTSRNSTSPKNISFPDVTQLLNTIRVNKTSAQEFGDIFEKIINFLEMVLNVFIVSTIRWCEDEIADEPPESRKTVRSIKDLIKKGFRVSSLKTLQELARHCYHLIDDDAPEELRMMKHHFGESVLLKQIGDILDDLEKVFPPLDRRSTTNKAQTSKRLLDYIMHEFGRYGHHLPTSRAEIEAKVDELDLNIETWCSAFEMLIDLFSPVVSQTYVLRELEKVDTSSGTYVVKLTKYGPDTTEISENRIPYKEVEHYGNDISELLMTHQGHKISVRLFPFLTIKNDRLYFYKITRASGYEYLSNYDNNVCIIPTKKKFNYSVFETTTKGDQQALFWAEVIPTLNEKNSIRANIPTEGLSSFVGRRYQLTQVKKQIINIVNRDGIIYGPGGVGKTSLIQQLTQELFDEEDIKKVTFNNIIWVSAKSNYYNYIHDIVEERGKEIISLDNILAAIFDFFEYGDMDGYTFEDKKELALELFQEERILLILDNFESIRKVEAERIIKFFGDEVKTALALQPDFFKTIITSRRHIISGFYQMPLKGLSLGDSEKLVKKLFVPYENSREPLTSQQLEKLHDVTSGIPIIIKHCVGQIFEFNKPFNSVIKGLADVDSNQVIKFSFQEILRLLKQDKYQLQIIILLELINMPLMIRLC